MDSTHTTCKLEKVPTREVRFNIITAEIGVECKPDPRIYQIKTR